MENALELQKLEQIRVAIQREFLERCRKNPAYSLRAYAKYLEIDQSFLSKLLKGRRPLTRALAETIGPKVGVTSKKVQQLFAAGAAPMAGFNTLTEDEFEMLAEWHHFALLELAKTKGFNYSHDKIAQRLGIHKEEVRDGLERLARLGFIQIKDKSVKILSPNSSWSNSKKTSVARTNLQRTLLEKSLHALDHVPFDLRDHGSLTIAINKARLPEFKEKLKSIRKEIADHFQRDGEENLDEVYQLTVSFFPSTK